MDNKQPILLQDMGFSALEVTVYLTLLRQNNNATGYRIAKITGRPVPNIYKALESLQKKGAVVSKASEKSRRYSALPIEQYFDQLEVNLQEKRKRVEAELKDLKPEIDQEDVYRIENIDQVFSRCMEIIDSAQELVLIDATAESIAVIQPAIQRAVKKGVVVTLKTDDDSVTPGCHVVRLHRTDGQRIDWPFNWLVVAADGSEYLAAFIKKGNRGVLQAFWSKSPYLSLMTYSGMAHEFILTEISSLLLADEPASEIKTKLIEMKDLLMYQTSLADEFVNLVSMRNSHE